METTSLLVLGFTKPSTASGSMPTHIVPESYLLTQILALHSRAQRLRESFKWFNMVHWDAISLAVGSEVNNVTS